MFSEDPGYPSIDQASDLALIAQIQSAGSLEAAYRARNALVERYQDLAAATVRRTVPSALSSHADDARQEASCALIEAAATFDPNGSAAFRAYAWVAMTRRIREYLRRHRHPVEGQFFGRRLDKVHQYLSRAGKAPDDLSDLQLAAGTGLSALTIRRLRPWLNAPQLLDARAAYFDREPKAKEEERVDGESLLIPAALERQEAAQRLREMVNVLNCRDRHLLTRVYGLDGDEPVTVTAAAAAIGLNAPAGSMRLRRALARLRRDWRD